MLKEFYFYQIVCSKNFYFLPDGLLKEFYFLPDCMFKNVTKINGMLIFLFTRLYVDFVYFLPDCMKK